MSKPRKPRSTGAGFDAFAPAEAEIRRSSTDLPAADLPERTATAEELAEERAKVQRGRAMAGQHGGRPPNPPRPTRFTLDLDQDRHQFLKRHAVDVGVDASRLVRALLDELRDDDDLQGRIWTRIWQPR